MWDYSWTGVRLSSAPLNDKNDLRVVFIMAMYKEFEYCELHC